MNHAQNRNTPLHRATLATLTTFVALSLVAVSARAQSRTRQDVPQRTMAESQQQPSAGRRSPSRPHHTGRVDPRRMPLRHGQALRLPRTVRASAIPRAGQEVVVDFLEGDPDRPIVAGRVYNAERQPPYDLEDRAATAEASTTSVDQNEAAATRQTSTVAPTADCQRR